MYKGNSIAVVVTAYEEASFVGRVIETVPEFVDRIYAVDDASPDDSWEVITRVADRINESTEPDMAIADGGDARRVVPIRHDENRGYGAAVKTGYRRAGADGIDVVAVMNGDGQMDPEILDRIVDPVVSGEADYAKGNRLLSPEDREGMSTFRFVGNAMLTGLSKFASGYWTIGDPQNGYTAISREAIEELDLEAITDQYGFLNHVLTHLNVAGFRVADVAMSAVYGEEESSIRYVPFVRFVSLLLLRSFLWRLKRRYVVEGFHPAVVFYGAGTAGIASGSTGLAGSLRRRVHGEDAFAGTAASFATLLLGVVSLGAAIWMDAEESADLEITRYEYDDTEATTAAAEIERQSEQRHSLD
ncbi:glycosyltransferase family 2 protein [Natronobacterium gregoryi]|uniref:Glycosyl transferase n=2 Tax=Natronobacterium gregoryi TaxID=44930 RepID=L0AL02_NATGS|nr:glycosyltransferase family 2 protein [Natronobacterium gregoryi]AFZ74109.1 glycosyl transferase [Natronobacterium gregoryi SP2]ELY63845.1 family 2 glycosyl transferase [Natronobacterium gregoryi SP2]PLK18724.1 glycosyltransferase family 2 protein [Natronobacterium gregoryi SP2]SFJ66939.1 Glycosyltransferase involved in cell wall bisynthesis [Natronobacterium gregoryi]